MEKSAYIEKKIGKNLFADSTAMFAKFVSVLSSVLKNEGNTATVAVLNALVEPMPNLVIKLTDAGTLSAGTDLVVTTGDTVYFDGVSWQKINLATTKVVEVVTDNRTLTAADSGKVFLIATDAKVFSLPATAAGLEFTFINFGAAGNNIVTISPVAADGISGTITLANTVVVDAGVVDKDLINTKATSQCGDTVKLLGTGVTGTKAWIIVHSTGIWAAQG